MLLHSARHDVPYLSQTARILVADHCPGQRAILDMLLAADGHAVTTVADSRAALHHLKHHTPDLVVLDAAMPDISGLEICERLRQVSRLRAVPVLMLTAPNNEQAKAKASAAGASAVVSKPLAGKDIRALVRGLLT